MLSLTKGQPDCKRQPDKLLLRGVSAPLLREGGSGSWTHPQLHKPSGPLRLFPFDFGGAILACIRRKAANPSLAAPPPQPAAAELLLPSPSVRLEEKLFIPGGSWVCHQSAWL